MVLSCCEHYGNVLYRYNNSELKAVCHTKINHDIVYCNSNDNVYILQILEVATRKVDFLRSDMISQYKEVE